MSPAGSLAEAVDAALPQTQCTRCGYSDCRAYADAIALGEADINRCPPGGEEGIARLSRLTGRPALPLDPSTGREGPRQLAKIDEDWCIGCTLCIKACPVDAIVGAAKRMHDVIDPLCTGCELCIPVCPVDCISLVEVTGHDTGWNAWSTSQAEQAKRRYAFHRLRLQRDQDERNAPLAARAQAQLPTSDMPAAVSREAASDPKENRIAAALAQARRRNAGL